MEINKEKIDNTKISRLAAAIKMPSAGRSNVLYLGWTEGGLPTVSWDGAELSESSKESLKISKTIKMPSSLSFGGEAIEPVQYMAPMPAIDKPDTEGEYTEDIMVLGVVSSRGSTEYIHIEELELMQGILEGHIVWQDVNSRTLMGDQDVTPTLPMHAVLLPAHDSDGKRTTYAMLFEPTMASESNEPAFKLFLAQTLKSFLALDLRQDSESKKGYEKIITEERASEGKGGDAYFIMRVLKDLGFEVSRERLDRVWRESAGKSFGQQLLLVAREFGLVNFNSSTKNDIRQGLDKLKTEDLMNLMAMCYRAVSQKLRRGRR